MGLSDTAVADPQMQAIMNGGENWMARMTALLKAKEEADAAVKQANVVGDIVVIRQQAEWNRAESVSILDEARRQARDIVGLAKGLAEKTQADAAKKDAEAKEQREALMAEVVAKTNAMTTEAAAHLDEARRQRQQTESSADRLDIALKAAEDREKEAAKAYREANAQKAAYEKKLDKLQEFLKKESA